jgi:hypothetical protein
VRGPPNKTAAAGPPLRVTEVPVRINRNAWYLRRELSWNIG